MEKFKNKKVRIIVGVALVLMMIALITAIVINQVTRKQKSQVKQTGELARAKNYDVVEEGDEAVEGTENVKFDAFFLRDLDGDGYAESIRGTCKEIGSEDTLYMEINVQTAGYLRDAKITIDGKNFYLQTALPKDDQLTSSYIGDNIKEIKFNNLSNGTQKIITGIVRSGNYSYSSSKTSAIGKDINNYSRDDNKIILTGIYVGEDGTEKSITKEVPFTMDWYGTTRASIYSTKQNAYIDNYINEEARTIDLDFTIKTLEENNKLILKTNHTEGEIPKLNGYEPTNVIYTGTHAQFNYDEATRKFTIDRTSIIEETGGIGSGISNQNSYGIRVIYPLEAYETLGRDAIQVKVPVKTYYEGYNNPNIEFKNPYKSNVAQATIVATYEKYVPPTPGQPTIIPTRFSITVGEFASKPDHRYIITKQKPLKIYNGQSEEEKDDTYIVKWRAYVGTDAEQSGIIMKETKYGEQQVTDQFIKTNSQTESTDDVVSNIGIYFTGADTVLGEEGWIKIYDEETNNLLKIFTQNDWNKYTRENPYKYETPIKHIRIETSNTVKSKASLFAYNIKEIDNEAITNKYTREQFDELQYISSTLVGYISNVYVEKDIHQAIYESPKALATLQINKDTISTQYTEENVRITVSTKVSEADNIVNWKDGTFLIKFPIEILDVQINSVTINNKNVKIENYELIEQDDQTFIKIATNNINPQNYIITIDVDLSPDPRKATSTRDIELYAVNENGSEYYYKTTDIYDVNNNLNTIEQVNYTTTSISMIAPNSLLTNQTGSDYDDKGSIVVSPKIAEVRPIYTEIGQEKKEDKTAKIGIQLQNNYASTISEIKLLGKIPFEGNTYVMSGKELGSTFTTKMTNTGIEIPEELIEVAQVYYSENKNPDKELTKTENGWKKADQVENWDNIKTFLIDLGDYVMPTGKEFVFNYIVTIPNGLEFNKVSYSHHGVYFCLDTDHGKYKTQTEPNRLGFRIAEKYDLEIQKYQTGKEKLVPGATYSITEIIQKEDGTEEKGDVKTGLTNENGTIKIINLYAKKVYEVKEIKTPDDYEINTDVIRFISNVDEYGVLTINKIEGTTKGDIEVTKNEGESYKVTLKVEDEAKATLKITKKEKDSENRIRGVKYKITGYNLPENGRAFITNINGETTIKGLSINQEYILEEVRAEGYYINKEPIIFKIVNNDGKYSTEIKSGIIKENNTIEEDNIPYLNIILENEKIPTYDLEITKIKRIVDVTTKQQEEIEEKKTYLQGAKFKLYKDNKEIGTYITDENGKITINNLYKFIDGKGEDAIYTLKEVIAPIGYAKAKDVIFKVQENEGLELINLDEKQSKYTTEGNIVKLIIEDSPSFKLIKKDGETGKLLSNVKFAIYNIDNEEKPAVNSKGEILGTKETIDGKEYYTISTDNNGEITADLPEGAYKVVEVQAEDKYDITDSTYYFGIGTSSQGRKTLQEEWDITLSGIECALGTSDEGIIVGGHFNSYTIDLGNGVVLNTNGSYDGMIIKYNSYGEVEWGKVVGGTDEDRITCITETSDGGYIAGGYFGSISIDLENGVVLNNKNQNQNRSYSDGMIIKYDENGNVEWGKVVGGEAGGDYINCITETRDGGIIVGGDFNSSTIELENGVVLTNNGSGDGMIIKYNSYGEIEWGKSFGGAEKDYINCITETEDGGYAVGGYFNSSSIELGNGVVLNNNGSYDGMIIKYNSYGEIEWGKSFGGAEADYINCITETEDGGYAVGGYFQSSYIDLENGIVLNNMSDIDYGIAEYYDGIIIKYDTNGNIEWGKAVGGSRSDKITCITETSDGGIIIGGHSRSINVNLGTEVIVCDENSLGCLSVKYNKHGNVEWSLLDGERYIIAETKDGKYLTQKYSTSSNVNIGISKCNIDEKGNLTIQKVNTIGGSSSDDATCIIETKDGGYAIGGYFESSSIELGNGVVLSNNGYEDGMIIKYDEGGNVEWGKVVGGSADDSITCITETEDGGYIVGGEFESSSIDLGNGQVLNNNGNVDIMIIKYNEKGEVEWGKSIGGSNNDKLSSIVVTEDGGYIVGGEFDGSIKLEDGRYLNNVGAIDGMIIKYDKNNEIEYAQIIGGEYEDRISEIIKTEDKGYIVIGYFQSSYIDLGNGIVLDNEYSSYNSMIIKYDVDDHIEWKKTVEYGNIKCITQTTDGGYLIGEGSSSGQIIKINKSGDTEWKADIEDKLAGGFYSISNDIKDVVETMDGGFIVLVEGQVYDYGYYIPIGRIMKYDCNGKIERSIIRGTDVECINKGKGGKYLICGEFNDDLISENGDHINQNGYGDVMILEIQEKLKMPEKQELVIENIRKEFKITTNVKEINGVKGGSISGEGQIPYEIVKYGDINTKDIIITPEENYEIIAITVNGKEHLFTVNEDGTYTIPQFENITEDKNIEVTFALKDNKIVINKVDASSRVKLLGAKFRLDQLEERTEPENILGEIVSNGEEYIFADKTNEIEGVLGNLENDGGIYRFKEKEGKYESVNDTSTIYPSEAKSYIKIDLTNKEGKYIVVVNAEAINSKSNDHGYAIIAETTTSQSHTNQEGRFMYTSWTTEAEEYNSEELEGGKVYYLHLGYYKNRGTYAGKFVVNSIKVYKSATVRYNFIEKDGKYESNNQGKDNTVANSYIPIDLTSYSGKYNLIVNAEVSSQKWDDIGYITLTETTTAPKYNSAYGQFVYISGEENAKDYTTVLQGGQMYYLHLGYYKNESSSEGDDKFTINSIKVTLNDAELYHTELETNSQGQAIGQIPFGKYRITEIKAPEGYLINEEPIVIEFRADENHEFTIENVTKAKVIVHHYKAIKQADGSYIYTEEQLAESQVLEGKQEERYTSIPYLDIGRYELAKDEKGEYIVPENAVGKFTAEETEVKYYYVEKEIPLTVHHYIEGTEEKVLLKDGTKAEDVIIQGKENEEYTTEMVSNENLNEEYELVETPENAKGIYTGDEIIVTYYYKKVKREVRLNKYTADSTTPLEGVKFTINKKEEGTEEVSEATDTTIYTTNAQGRIKVELEVGEYEITEIETVEGYQIPENATREITITRETEKVELDITNEKKKGTVITHHYIEGTEEKLPLGEGKVVEDEIQTGEVGEPFATKELEEIPTYCEYVSSSEKTYGEYTEETIEVIYYYRLKEYNYKIEYYYNKKKDETATETGTAKYGEKIKEYTDKIKEEYELRKVENLPLTITENEEENIIKIYYAKDSNLSYTVNYLEKDTNEILHEAKEEAGQELDTIITAISQVIPIEGYKYSHSDKESITISEEENVINIYYTKRKDLSYTVNYLEKGTNEELHEAKEVKDQEFKKEIISSDEIITIDGYNYDSVDKESIIIGVDETQNVINIYYTIRTDIKYKVEYYYNGEKDEEETEEYTATYKEIIEEYEDKIKEDYIFVEVKGTPLTITAEEEQNIIQVYYAKTTTAKVQYIDKNTDEVIEERTEEGYIGKEFVTIAKDIENYILVEEPEEKTVLMEEEEIVVKYYYAHVSSGVIEKHIDIETDEILYNTTHEGKEGDEYKTEAKEFEGYKIVEEKYPENSEGKMEIEAITVNYYYKKKVPVTITVKYIDKETKEEIEEIIIKGYEEDEYKTEQKEIEGYEFVEVEGETEGKLTEDKEVIYYYQKIKEPEVPGEGGGEDENKPQEPEDPTTVDKVIPSAGLTKEQIAIIVVTVMGAITGILVTVAIKGIKLDKKH